MGRNILMGSHFDEYLLDFTAFKPGKPHKSAFQEPDVCKGVAPSGDSGARGVAAAQRAAVMPWTRLAHAAGEQLQGQQLLRAQAYAKNLELVKVGGGCWG